MAKGKFKGIKMEGLPTLDPPPYAQLDRIERMLKWVIVRKKLDYLSHDLEHNEYKEEFRKPILNDMFKLGEQLPDIGDIIKD